MSPVSRESIKAASIVSALVGVVGVVVAVIGAAYVAGRIVQSKADLSAVQANTERIVHVETDVENAEGDRAQLLAAINRVDDKVQRLLERP